MYTSNTNNDCMLNEQYKKAVDISTIVTKTNAHGVITYANDEFIKISGYSSDELIGKPHNIVSHPDTSKVIFKDLWNTIKAKKVWKGIIKNRAKDNSSYTVIATIMPIVDEDDNIVEFIAIRQDITEVIKQKEIINRQTTDELTKLPNREKLLQNINESKYPNLALINLNNFRDINELYGFQTGDKVLTSISKIILKYFNNKDHEVYKLPSDEFAVFLDDAKDIHCFQDTIIELSNHLKKIELNIDDHVIYTSITAGIAHSKQDILLNANIALQGARKLKQTSVVYDENCKIKESVQNNLNWHQNIKKAIKDDRIIPYFQPIYNVATKKIEKYEALVRLLDENDEIISPYFFLDIAKKYHQYEHITMVMIKKTFEYFKNRSHDFSINLSIEDIINNHVVEYIFKSIQNFPEPNRIIFEITESEGIENFTEVELFLNRIKKLGCKIAIDDFGTGYSNFEYILRLDVDYIKIDGSIVKNIIHSNESRVVLETIISFAKKLGISTISEFVSSKDIYNMTKELGATHVQGYYVGKPQDSIDHELELL